MEKKELMEYLKSAISLETDIATQGLIIQSFDNDSQARKPQLILQNEPGLPSKPEKIRYWEHDLFGAFGSSPIGPVVLSALLGVIAIFESENGASGLALITWILAALVISIPIIKGAVVIKTNLSAEKKYQNEMTKYKERVAQTKVNNESAKQTYQTNLPVWEANSKQNRSTLSQRMTKTKVLLNKLYESDFIYSKYRNLPALTSIYEYLITGRCDELTGPNGAYNLYEAEIRQNIIIAQLNKVIEQLEQIKQHQYLLYQKVSEIKNETVKVTRELKQIKGYTVQLTQLASLNAYYAALTERNTHISAFFHIMNG